jgi:hypothetical protein
VVGSDVSPGDVGDDSRRRGTNGKRRSVELVEVEPDGDNVAGDDTIMLSSSEEEEGEGGGDDDVVIDVNGDRNNWRGQEPATAVAIPPPVAALKGARVRDAGDENAAAEDHGVLRFLSWNIDGLDQKNVIARAQCVAKHILE